jgi:hypothetical protein
MILDPGPPHPAPELPCVVLGLEPGRETPAVHVRSFLIFAGGGQPPVIVSAVLLMLFAVDLEPIHDHPPRHGRFPSWILSRNASFSCLAGPSLARDAGEKLLDLTIVTPRLHLVKVSSWVSDTNVNSASPRGPARRSRSRSAGPCWSAAECAEQARLGWVSRFPGQAPGPVTSRPRAPAGRSRARPRTARPGENRAPWGAAAHRGWCWHQAGRGFGTQTVINLSIADKRYSRWQ